MSLPLAGLHVVVTRPRHQAASLTKLLEERGARVSLLPTVAIAPPADLKPLQDAAQSLREFALVVFSSANAVRALAAELPPGAQSVPAAAIGPATEEAARAAGFRVLPLPERFVAEDFAAALANQDLRGQKVLVPAAAEGRDVVPRSLRELGAEVTVVEAYRNVCPPDAAAEAARVFAPPFPDWCLLASPSAFHNLRQLVDGRTLARVHLGAIGPTTAAAIRNAGFTVALESPVQTAEGMVDALVTMTTRQ